MGKVKQKLKFEDYKSCLQNNKKNVKITKVTQKRRGQCIY